MQRMMLGGDEVFYKHARTVLADVTECCRLLGLEYVAADYRGAKLIKVCGVLSGTRVVLWIPAAYPDEPPIVDGRKLKSTAARPLLEVCKALEAELQAEPQPQAQPELEPEPEPNPGSQAEPPDRRGALGPTPTSVAPQPSRAEELQRWQNLVATSLQIAQEAEAKMARAEDAERAAVLAAERSQHHAKVQLTRAVEVKRRSREEATAQVAAAREAQASAERRLLEFQLEAANAQARARDAEARAEEEKAAAALERVQLPPDWTSVTDSTGLEFVDMSEKRGFFERKMKASAKVTPYTTADQRMDRLHVHRVTRVENARLFESYQRKRIEIFDRLDATRAAGHSVPRLQEHAPDWLADKPGFPAVTDEDTNEFWLWHGTKPETWEVLARHGFDQRVAEDGGLYGAGSYFADASSKSHQYAAVRNGDGHHCMLSCRVTMGHPYMTPGRLQGQRRPPLNTAGETVPAVKGLPYDSVFAEEGVTDNGVGLQFHNEFVVFEKAQVYPEYVIWYTLED